MTIGSWAAAADDAPAAPAKGTAVGEGGACMIGDVGEGVSVGSGFLELLESIGSKLGVSSAGCPVTVVCPAGLAELEELLEEVNENRTLGAPNREAISRTEGICLRDMRETG